MRNSLYSKCFKLIVVTVLFVSYQVSAQQIAKPEVPKEKTIGYVTMIAQNGTLVSFIENTLANHGLPKFLRNLAMIESGFNKNAISSARAGGLWQFTVGHASTYGLSAQNRFDVYKSTQIAAQSLKDLYGKYGNWIAVVAAYNCGEGAVDKAMRKARSNRYDQYYTYLPAETIGHVHKFMVACAATDEFSRLRADYKMSAFKDTREKNSAPQKYIDPALVSTTINNAFDLAIICQEMAIDRSDLNKWNPDLLKELGERSEASLCLPVDMMPDFLLLKSMILSKSLNNNAI
ncbi:MAG: lytic transglycosylase domain-containing protein [Pedobacter sp.]|nr:MAG: lytic transglycosylase domain-containing protein [Pedobacter sp.]